VIRDRFDYFAPTDIASVTGIIASLPDRRIKLLAGGTMLVPDLTLGRVRPSAVIDLRRAGLTGVRSDEGFIFVGATTTYADLLRSGLVSEHAPLLGMVARTITGGPQIRNRGTIGGSACYANPSSDVPACLVALGATMRLASARSDREVAARDFFLGPFRCAAEPDEALHEVAIPKMPDRTKVGYYKLKLCEGSWPVATAACSITFDGDGSLRSASLVLGGVSEAPIPLDEIERVMADTSMTRDHLEEIGAIASNAIAHPWSDELADGEYRRKVAGVVARRAVSMALGQEDGW
jgi:CO/xanthine dehydrogenase FAD-binding subunit